MNTTLNLTAIYIANILGIMMLSLLFLNNSWRLTARNKESNILVVMMLTCLIACISDPISFYCDSKPGLMCRIAVYAASICQYGANMIIGPAWIGLIVIHTGQRISKLHQRIIAGVCILGTAVLIANFFYPLVFSVDETNKYSREELFWLYTVMQMLFVADGLCIYALARKNGGILKFFPAVQFVVPVVIGILIQSKFYGVSMIWPCFAVSISGLLSSLQNEALFRDQLTGLFNRFYMDNLKSSLTKTSEACFTAMMLDLNDFKSVNDRFGHSVGDEALIDTARILSRQVGSAGTVIRYAGDEFVILLNMNDEDDVNRYIERIREAFARFNDSKAKDYKLSVSIGSCSMNLKDKSIDEILSEVDQRMYEDKKRFYETNPDHERRRNR